MSEAYNYAVERAELLGLPIPNFEEWTENQKAQEANNAEPGDDDDAILQNLDSSNESAQRVSGGLDELNSILNVTQKKINRFKTVCGSLSTLLKVKVGSRSGTPNHKSLEHDKVKEGKEEQITLPTEEEESMTVDLSENSKNPIISDESNDNIAMTKKIDINAKMGSHLGKLDSLITKAENAQYSMQHQTKQMRKFLK
ncbi:PREDICTED: uncharacterized protein LOC107066539 [Polistes dominula]|uniref:Uncharacterized protein LOC107066539 n=1 Tax=Polistes dominula TaxID=743375 RepID=A0ABM1I944_POLDO|nr:PREDICTED: uncharacterized protein LOC107066539 [Polistes dominula]XP_015176731.1 PREDICTED: uncharacterized protein LOC107066539 [Polistes dominula]XP_015176732.1 PREDICTED: uncharacterized protein LOC107066539 [Polistes dominula]